MRINRSMKPRKGKTMSKAGGYVCICDTSTADTGLRAVPHPGLRRQDARSGSQREQVKSVWPGQTKVGESGAAGYGDRLAADRTVVAMNGGNAPGAKGPTYSCFKVFNNRKG